MEETKCQTTEECGKGNKCALWIWNNNSKALCVKESQCGAYGRIASNPDNGPELEGEESIFTATCFPDKAFTSGSDEMRTWSDA